MNLVDHSQHLPAGLIDGSVEFFLYDNEVRALYKGCTYAFKDFPKEILDIVSNDMLANPKAMESLAKWDITDPDAQIRQYIACRFGGFDSNPDITASGEIHHREYFNCGRRGICPYEGKLCATIKVAHGELTKREIEVLRAIGLGKLDKEICDELNICQDTLRSHKDNISVKTGEERKPALGILAHKLNLI